MRHRVKVIDRFEKAGDFFLRRFIDIFFNAVDHLFHFHRLLHRAIEPIDAGRVRAKIHSQCGIVAQKLCDGRRVFIVDQKRRLIRRTRIRNDVDLGARHSRLGACFNLLQRFHNYVRSIFGGRNTSGFAGGSRSCAPKDGTGNSLGCVESRCAAFSLPVSF